MTATTSTNIRNMRKDVIFKLSLFLSLLLFANADFWDLLGDVMAATFTSKGGEPSEMEKMMKMYLKKKKMMLATKTVVMLTLLNALSTTFMFTQGITTTSLQALSNLGMSSTLLLSNAMNGKNVLSSQLISTIRELLRDHCLQKVLCGLKSKKHWRFRRDVLKIVKSPQHQDKSASQRILFKTTSPFYSGDTCNSPSNKCSLSTSDIMKTVKEVWSALNASPQKNFIDGSSWYNQPITMNHHMFKGPMMNSENNIHRYYHYM